MQPVGAPVVGRCVDKDIPVILRHEILDFLLALAEDRQGDRLHPSGREPAADLLPEERAQRVAHQAVKHAPRLLRVDPVHIDRSRFLDGVSNGVRRDLMKADPAVLLWIDAEQLGDVPGDRLSFAVGVGGEEYFLGRSGGGLKLFFYGSLPFH